MLYHEKPVKQEYIYRGRIINLRCDDAVFPDGKECKREVVEHNGAVAVVVLDEEKNIYLVRQYRYPFEREFLEIPAGKLDSKDEKPYDAAVRELREETGFTADSMEFLGAICPSVAILTEKIHIFLARGLHEGSTDFDDDEYLDTVKMPLAELEKMAAAGEIQDAKTLCALYLLHSRLDGGK